jgi:hypothetical protein
MLKAPWFRPGSIDRLSSSGELAAIKIRSINDA